MNAILTWTAYENFGTQLQAYALQQTLKRLGCDSRIIDDSRYTFLSYLPRGLKGWLRLFLRHPRGAVQLYRRHRPFVDFRMKHLRRDTSWRDVEDLRERYDTFVCGSDQIWSPLLPEHHDGFYFASFADGRRRVAYAPSLGTGECDGAYREMAGEWMGKFDCLSVREGSGAKPVKEMTGRDDVEVVFDPTLLLTAGDWDRVAARRRKWQGGKYVLAYFLTMNEKYLGQVRKYADEAGLPLVVISTGSDGMRSYADRYVETAGPAEFVRLVRDAERVFTDSFHGSIFSILYHRDFVTFRRFSDGDRNNQNSRVEHLFSELGIRGNFVDSIASGMPPTQDWNSVERRLEELKRHSIRYLTTSMKV